MIKLFILTVLAVFGFADKLQVLRVAGPVASVSHPIIQMAKTNALNDVADKIEFKLWKNPDELRAMILKKEVDFVAVPTDVAANLYNKNQPIKMINVSVWGILDIISRDANAKKISDLKGKEIVVPFRADMPDHILKAILQKNGLDPKKDIKINYVPTPPDAMQMLILRRADHVLLAEPATSAAMRKTGSFPLKLVAPELYRNIDLQREWGEAFKTQAKIPTSGVASIGEVDPKISQRFLEEYTKALEWYKNNPKEAGEIVAKEIPFFEAEVVADSISHVQLKSVGAKEAKKDLGAFFEILKGIDPKSIGGKLPEDGFYGL